MGHMAREQGKVRLEVTSPAQRLRRLGPRIHLPTLRTSTAFIGFVCFFGVALPLICLVTALLHYNKYERCKHHVRHLRLEYQREQLERELATGGNEEEAEFSTRSQRSGNASSSSRDAHTGAARGALEESSYQPLAGEPAATSSAFLRPS
ncbi:hypothetical protein AK812_SmicGene21013 [Symbiodinium microadriaticum]|uniref:Uncharacterized protein n=1 Tax=Symbiodinium microadriaticum TaxID=2951 RepID=A0A1Q9DNI2_SYMMI|nr:hypothetical protein AK812_SmicGene21013 [Symbiodinium microadriaticum]